MVKPLAHWTVLSIYRELEMAHIRQRSTGTWEIPIRRENLPKPSQASADTEAEARVWTERMEAQLDSGFIPEEILTAIQRSQKNHGQMVG